MNENILLVVDYDKICRLCLHTTGAMSDLFEKNCEKSLKDMVHRATGLSVEENDGFPTKVCHRCRYMVELSCDLKNMVERTNNLLINASSHLETMDVEQEKTPDQQIATFEGTASLKHSSSFKKPDLRLIMQDDGVMALVPPNLGTPVDDVPPDLGIPVYERPKEVEEKENDVKIISKERNVFPKQLTCQICLTTFPDEADVKPHVDLHYVDSNLTPYTKLQRPYKCETCRKTLNKAQLIQHHRTHLNVNPFVCKHAGCSFVGKNQDSLRRHLSTHSSRTQVCEICGAAYKRFRDLQLHKTRAHRPAPAHCRTCRKRFRNAVSLEKHVRHYHKPRRYKCEWPGCSKAYHTASCLAVHTRSHTDDRLFRCHLCSAAAYTTQSLLNRHLRCHKRSGVSKCDICSETFEDYSAFYRHRISQHGRWLPYRCIGCQKRFKYESKLEKHLETCEQAMQTLDSTVPTEKTTEHMLFASKQDTIRVENESMQDTLQTERKSVQMEGEIHNENTEDWLDKFRGQTLVVQPGNLSDLSKELELHDLPADALLFIELDSEAEEDVLDAWQQLSTQNN